MMRRPLLSLLFMVVACADQSIQRTPTATVPPGDTPETPPGEDVDASTPPSTPPPPGTPPPTSTCATTFGAAITPAFGRLDGTIRNITVPNDKSCRHDDNHVILQLDAGGATYMVWIDVESTFPGDPKVSIATHSAALGGPAWSVGWHTGFTIDYGGTLGVHSNDAAFMAYDVATLSTKILSQVKPGAQASAYMSGFDTSDGGHKVHRNGQNDDGALVILGSGTPTWLLFRFADQVF